MPKLHDLEKENSPGSGILQTLILILKSGKPLCDPSAYGLICLVNTIGKLPIAVIEGGFSGKQFGFDKARSAVNAINMVTDLAQAAVEECCPVTLDVENKISWRRNMLLLTSA